MRATYRRELEAKRLLDEQVIENFVPMRYEVVNEKRQKKRRLVPVIHNLIFVHTTPAVMKQTKAAIPYLQYLTKIENARREPIIVPDEQMRRFIAVVGSGDEQLLYLEPGEIDLKRGARVRICGGALDGQEGLFQRVKGVRDKRLVVMIQGVIAVATAVVHPSLVEVIS